MLAAILTRVMSGDWVQSPADGKPSSGDTKGIVGENSPVVVTDHK